MKLNDRQIEANYQAARETYAAIGINTEESMAKLAGVPISLHCWQGDDVGGFENSQGLSGGGIQATGNYPGKAGTAHELRQDLEMVYRLLPGRHRLNLHAIYAETDGQKVERTDLLPRHFSGWMEWARQQKIGLDFNGSFFSHPKAANGFTLSSQDPALRAFWIQHGKACRKIGAHFGRELKTPCVTNIWIPDGYKDIPIDRKIHREILKGSLDEILSESLDPACHLDAVEPKLFGIGSESCVIGSHEFYLAYAVSRKILLCLDAGHYHPTEVISDKISSVLMFLDRMLLHVSRGVRWDSDHVVILTEELQAIAAELARGNELARVHIGLDFFDASINRIAAWTIGARCMLKALMIALLEPIQQLKALEREGDFTARLAMLEELKTMPFGAVWDYYCLKANVPAGWKWMEEVKSYEKRVLSKRG